MKQLTGIRFILSLAVFSGLALSAQAQTTSVLTTGLHSPTKMLIAKNHYLLVAEAGAVAANTGRISVVDTASGVRQTLVAGLPSGISNLGGIPEMSGPSGLAMRGTKLYVTIGSGDAMVNVGPGLEAVNPDVSSPLFGSVLELDLPGNFTKVTQPYVLSDSDQAALAEGEEVVLTNGSRREATLRVVANLPDYVPNPRPDAPDNLRASNVFGVENFQNELYVVDASLNLVYRVDTFSGDYATFATFANKANPLFPNLGGPTVEPVPDNIHRVRNSLLVPLLTGFPFVPGLAEIQTIKLKTGEHAPLISGLTSAIDVLHAGGDRYYTLEFSANQLANEPGRVNFHSSPEAVPMLVATDLVTPTSMAMDDATGDIFVSEIGTGRIIRIDAL